MVPLAPRYDERIHALLVRLDDRTEPMAETCRRVGEAAAELGLPRPSYVHLRRLIHAQRERQDDERARREEIRAVIDDVAYRAVAGLRIDPYAVAERLERARR